MFMTEGIFDITTRIKKETSTEETIWYYPEDNN